MGQKFFEMKLGRIKIIFLSLSHIQQKKCISKTIKCFTIVLFLV